MALPWKRRLTCPKCGGRFDYEFIPGASLTSVRLGRSRYMRCPICHRFSVFSLRPPSDPPAPLQSPATAATEAAPEVTGP